MRRGIGRFSKRFVRKFFFKKTHKRIDTKKTARRDSNLCPLTKTYIGKKFSNLVGGVAIGIESTYNASCTHSRKYVGFKVVFFQRLQDPSMAYTFYATSAHCYSYFAHTKNKLERNKHVNPNKNPLIVCAKECCWSVIRA